MIIMDLKIQYASDLHIEFPENEEYIKEHPLKPVGDILVLAGDILPFNSLHKHRGFFSYLADHFEITYWIPGNHEYYHSDIECKSGVLNEKILNNVFLVNNTSVVHQNIRLLFSTLWSNIGHYNRNRIKSRLNDFRLIKHNGDRFTIDHYNQLHQECVQFILHEISNSHDERLIVATHHVPTYINYPEFYIGDALNEAFATELSDLIKENKIDSWIYGHHHANIPEFGIAKTGMLTNQVGYVHRNEHRDFSGSKFIKIQM